LGNGGIAPRRGRFTHSTHFTSGWVGPRAGLDAVKRKIPSPDHPARSTELYHWAIPVPTG